MTVTCVRPLARYSSRNISPTKTLRMRMVLTPSTCFTIVGHLSNAAQFHRTFPLWNIGVDSAVMVVRMGEIIAGERDIAVLMDGVARYRPEHDVKWLHGPVELSLDALCYGFFRKYAATS